MGAVLISGRPSTRRLEDPILDTKTCGRPWDCHQLADRVQARAH